MPAAKAKKSRAVPFTNFTPLIESAGLRRPRQEAGAHIFENVTIIKAGLGNRRDRNFYPPHVLKEAADAQQFEGLKAYADHPTSVDEQIQPERSIRDYVGLYQNTRFSESGGGRVVGDLRIFRAHKWLADVVSELVEMGASDKIGLSINGRGATSPGKMKLEESGEEIDVNEVQKFIDLRSADVVTEAGAGGGFPQLLESARGAATKETVMKKSELLKKIAEAAAAGNEAEVKKLTEALAKAGDKKKAATKKDAKPADEDPEGADEGDDPELVEEADADEDEDADAEGDENDEDADGDEDVEESEDPDAELDDAVEEAKSDADVEDDEDGGCDENLEECDGGMKKGRMKKGMKEATPGRRWPVGIPTSGKGSALKRIGKATVRGRKFGEADVAGELHRLRVENQRLTNKLERVTNRNERLAEALRVHQKADAARKLLKESGIPAELRGDLVARLVRLPDVEAMEREIRFTQRLVESAAGKVRTEIESDFDEIEGAGSTRLRESFGGSGDEDVSELLSGLPVRSKK